jgi:hypothetical protein
MTEDRPSTMTNGVCISNDKDEDGGECEDGVFKSNDSQDEA